MIERASSQAQDVLERIRAQAARRPDAPAAADEVRRLTYAELVAEISGVAGDLTARKVSRGERVVLAIANSVDFVVAALACLWVGAVFVPVSPTDPAARIERLLADCDPASVLSGGPGAGGAESEGREPRASRPTSGPTPVAPVEPEQPAYIIYTSGTSGSPKGVVISRGAFARAIASSVDLLGLDEETRTLSVSAFHFDGSYGALFSTLAAGGCVVIPPRESLVFPRKFFTVVAREQISFSSFSPSYLRLLLGSRQLATLAATPLRTLVLGGEACSGEDLAILWAAAPDIVVFNRYGPTETTIAVTCHRVERSELDAAASVPIGRPTPGVTFTLVDDAGRVVEGAGRLGELYIGGAQLMDGYWGDPDLSRQVLRTDVIEGRLLYRSGDLAVRDDDGNYRYAGRADQVVKRSGTRISLLELAQALRAAPGVTGATCAPYDDRGRLAIAAFVAAPAETDLLSLREAAARWVPATMLPDLVKVVKNFPLTSSGKVDTRALLAEAELQPLSLA